MRRLNIPQEALPNIIADTIKRLVKGKKDVTINVSTLLKLPAPKNKINIHFSEEAYDKVNYLVANTDSEVAWHGIVEQIDDTFLIHDILVYPQIVAGATVESDDEAYTLWLESLSDAHFNNIRLQGHSHVNMGVFASATDDEFYETFIPHMKDYYIFMIMNKRKEMWFNVMDVINNCVYESADIHVSYVSSNTTVSWYNTYVKPMLKLKAVKPAVIPKGYYSSATGYSDHWDMEQDARYQR